MSKSQTNTEFQATKIGSTKPLDTGDVSSRSTPCVKEPADDNTMAATNSRAVQLSNLPGSLSFEQVLRFIRGGPVWQPLTHCKTLADL